MQDGQHRDSAPCDRSCGVEQRELMRQIEVGDGFVEQKRLAIMDCPSGLDLRHDPRELDPPLLSAGKSRVRARR